MALDNEHMFNISDSNMKSKSDVNVKIILLGDSAVGKSKLIERFLMDDYKPQQVSTYALTLYKYETKMENQTVTVDFWDTAGQDRFENIHPSYYHQAHCAIIIFDAVRKITYKHLPKWYEELRSYRPHIPCFCVVNKIDENVETTKRNFAFASKNELPFYYVSASDGTNVVKLFVDSIKAAIAYKQNPADLDDQILEELEATN